MRRKTEITKEDAWGLLLAAILIGSIMMYLDYNDHAPSEPPPSWVESQEHINHGQ